MRCTYLEFLVLDTSLVLSDTLSDQNTIFFGPASSTHRTIREPPKNEDTPYDGTAAEQLYQHKSQIN